MRAHFLQRALEERVAIASAVNELCQMSQTLPLAAAAAAAHEDGGDATIDDEGPEGQSAEAAAAFRAAELTQTIAGLFFEAPVQSGHLGHARCQSAPQGGVRAAANVARGTERG